MVTQGKVEGKGYRGRFRLQYVGQIMDDEKFSTQSSEERDMYRFELRDLYNSSNSIKM